jgi:hypothetical protein
MLDSVWAVYIVARFGPYGLLSVGTFLLETFIEPGYLVLWDSSVLAHDCLQGTMESKRGFRLPVAIKFSNQNLD